MNKPSLLDYNITDSQYTKFREYKNKCELRVKKIESVENNFLFILLIAFYPITIYLFFSKENISCKLSELYFLDDYWSLIGTIGGTLFLLTIVHFVIGLIGGGILSVLLSLIKVPNLIKLIYSKLYRQLPKESYYENIEKFEQNEKEYLKYIENLEKEYPNIVDFDYDKQRYFKNIFENIIQYEKKYINEKICLRNNKKQIDYWLSLGGIPFEHEVSDLYRKLGYKVETTRAVADRGVDIKIWRDEEYIIVQCKNHNNKIGPSVVRDLYGTMHKEKATRAILICSGGFNPGVFEFTKNIPIELIDINQLIEIANKVYPQKYDLITSALCSYCINPEITFEFKILGSVYILYTQHEKAILKDKTIYLTNPIDDKFSLFENIDAVKKTIESFKKQENKPYNEPCIYDISEWKVRDKTQAYKYKTFYYLRILKEEHKYFKSTIKIEQNHSFQQFNRKKRTNRWSKWRY